MRYNILFGGKAGQGPNILTKVIAESLLEKGYYVFYSRDYQSLIRGGHNFNVLTFSDEPVSSNDSTLDILVELDEGVTEIHKKELKKNAVILKGHKENMYYAGRIAKLLCLDFKILEDQFKKIGSRFEENVRDAKAGFDEEKQVICKLIPKKEKSRLMNGSQGVAEGAVKSDLDVYYAYPMTPATGVLMELAEMQKNNSHLVIELENETGVMNAALGSSLVGAKSMVGTSGGGFDLMTEALTVSGIAEIPVVAYLSQRPGPATGVATATAQGDLKMALNAGHGEFSRMVLAPGDPVECEEITSQAFYFSQKFKIPAIILSDKHLSEAVFTTTQTPKLMKSEKTIKLGRFNSYEIEHKNQTATEDAEIIKSNVEARMKKHKEIEKETEKFETFKVFGKKDSKNIILGWGSTKGAILDSIKNLDVKFIQIIYLEPFPSREIKKQLQTAKKIILVENNATAQLGNLLTEKTGTFIEEKNKILRYDGKPFLADELKKEIEARLK